MKKAIRILIVSVYVDDLIFTSNDEKMLQDFKKGMKKTYQMSDLGLLHWFLGIEIPQTKYRIFISQNKYMLKTFSKNSRCLVANLFLPLVANEKLKKEDGAKKADARMYRSLVGSLLYLTATNLTECLLQVQFHALCKNQVRITLLLEKEF